VPTASAIAASPSPEQSGIIPIVIPPEQGQLNNIDECYDGDISTS
jgi:hypothetical protein